jgi:cytochrome c oxidase subunit I+III
MMFLFAVPIMTAMGIYLVPLMVGARDVAFPRLNLYGYFVYLIGGILLYAGFLLNTGPDAGWFAYVPLVWSCVFARKTRRHLGPDDHLHRNLRARRRDCRYWHCFQDARAGNVAQSLPLFVWAQVVTGFMIIFAMPAVMLASSFSPAIV